MTRTVRLHSAVDVPMTVNTVWSGPNGFTENRVASRMQITNIYISETMFSSFGQNQSGNYSCTATVRPRSTSIYLSTESAVLSNKINIHICKYPVYHATTL